MGLLFSSGRFLHEFSTFGIGGPIQYFAEVHTIEEMREAFLFASQKRIPFFVLGKGSNCLFNDSGFSGVVLLNKIDFCSWNETSVQVGAGHSFSLLGSQSARRNFSGLEFASGIPASVGGAVFMNAGANGKETCESLLSVTYLHADGVEEKYSREALSFGYRHSIFHTMKGAIVSAIFSLTPHLEARPRQLQIIDYRMKTQPLKEKSIGCIFRNPAGQVSAGALIDRCGLKGFRVGGAKISEIHANFIINVQEATAKDVFYLIELIQKTVLETTGVLLEPEVRFI